MLFGRAAELEVGLQALAHVGAGRGTVLVLSGEPGIGKSTLARALADAGEQRGARVAFGRAWEVGGAPPYWPWTQALGEIGLDLTALLGSATAEGAGAQRVVAFDRVTRAVVGVADAAPLVLVLDDLHGADTASLELALALARGIARRRVLLLVTARESELADAPQHQELLTKLAREGQRISLRRLGESAVAEWLASTGYSGDAAEVARMTEGNPLFVEEAVRAGLDRLRAGGIAVMIREHLGRASEKTRAALAVASVLGREAPRDDVAKLAGDIDEAEAEALHLGILTPSKNAWLFSHVLIRDALYEALPASRRVELHAQAARLHGAPSHLLAGAPALPREIVVEGIAGAARRALAQHATDDAVALIERARQSLADRDEHAELTFELVLADARMRRNPVEGRVLATLCAERAKRLGRTKDLAYAALIYSSELATGQVDPTMVRLLEEALAPLPESEDRLRARVLTRLGAAMIPPDSEETFRRASGLASDGLAVARASGDPDTLLYALRFAVTTFGYAVDTKTRTTIMDELSALARAHGDEVMEANVGGFHVAHQFELGRPEQGRAAAERYCRLVKRLPLPHIQWRTRALDASLAALEGRFDDAYAAGKELHRTASESNARSGLLAWALMHISMGICSGNSAELEAHYGEIASLLQNQTFAPWLACAQALLGRVEDARRALGPVVDLPRGFPWLITAGQTVILLQDVELARRFYAPLCAEGLKGRFFWGPAGAFPLGPTARVLGELAIMIGHVDEAREHLDEAVAQCTAAEATSLLRLSQAARARIGGPPAPAKAAPLTLSLVREGDVWVVTSRREAIRVKHAKGFEYLAALLESPGREHYVLALAGAGEAPEDAGTVLDERARASYRARVEDLEDQLAEAERNGDRGHAERAREELEAVADQLAGAVGLGGRDRKAASNAERARINVQRRIKDAIRRVAEHDAELGRYLEATVRTGTYCSYRPI